MANPTEFTPITAPRILGDRDLREWMLDRMQQRSNGLINDRAPHAPTVVLTDVFEFVRLELEYAMDKIAERAATLHLQTCGIQRQLGRKAQVTLTFTLSSTLSQFVLSAGYMVTGDSGVEFFTDVDAIATNTNSFTVTATAKEVGTRYNVAAFSLNGLSQARAFLAGVTNIEAAAGGLDAETEDQAKARGYQQIRRKKGVLISTEDFEAYAVEVLGVGAIARCIPLLTPDKQEKQAGFVHIFCLNPDGSVLNEAQQAELQAAMNSQAPPFIGNPIKTAASGVSVSSIDLLGLEVSAIATLIPGDNPDTRAARIYQSLVEFLAPGRLPLGETVVLYSLITQVQNAGVQDVQSVSVNVTSFDELSSTTSVETFYGNIELPSEWTAAYCKNVAITLVNATTNTSFEYNYGEGGDLD